MDLVDPQPDYSPVLILAPSRRDAEVTQDLFERADISCKICTDAKSLATEIGNAVGAILLTDVAFNDISIEQAINALHEQPAWSDVPIVMMCRANDMQRPTALKRMGKLRNKTILERPSSSRTLLSSIQAALRARKRQYQIRDQLNSLAESDKMVHESEARFRSMANAIPQLAWMARPDGYIFWFNQRWYDYTGATLDQVQGCGWKQLLDPAHLERVTGSWEKSLATGVPFEESFPLRAKDTNYRWFLTRALPLRDMVGNVECWFGTNTDLTAQLNVEQALKQRQRELQSLIESTPDVLARFDKSFRHVFVNAAAARITGVSAENLLGRTNRDLGMPPKLCEIWESALSEVFTLHEPRTLEFNFPGADGNLYFSNLLIPERGDNGEVETVLCVAHDLTTTKNALNELQAADRRKDEFLAMLAHELRNPLAPIRNASELLARVLPSDAHLQNTVNILRRQSAHLTRLVDDLLDVSRINNGRIELQRETLELSQVVTQALETIEHLIAEKDHRLIFNPAQTPLRVHGDRARLVQSVANVLANAAKYTDPGGEISVEVQRQAQQAQILISDNGVGISPALLPRIFDLFVQSDRSLDRSQGGLGIGLSVVKRLVEMHDGQVRAFSAGIGKGSRFEIQLPLIEAEIDSAAAVEVPVARSKRILIVDDNQDAADSLAFVLGLDGHETEAVYSSRVALERAAAFQPDVILLDIGLPEMNGYEVATHLRQTLHSVRLIALTGYGTADDVRRAFSAGFDGHVIKPVDFEALGRIIEGDEVDAPSHA